MTRRRLFLERQWVGVRAFGWYVSLRGPKHVPLFSERLRKGCRVWTLRRGWRVVVRADRAGMAAGT